MTPHTVVDRHRLAVAVPLVVSAAGVLAYAVWLATGASAAAGLMNNGVYNVVVLAAAVACFAHAAYGRSARVPGLAFGIGLVCWALGNIYWDVALSNVHPVPYPSPADAGYLAVFPCFYVGIVALIKERVGHFTPARWCDGLIGALVVSAAATAFLAPALVDLTQGNAATVFTNLAYPLGDLLLIALIAATLVTTRHGTTALVFVGMGLLAWAGGDVIFLYGTAMGTYSPGGWTDLTWPAGSALIGASALFLHVRSTRHVGVYRSSIVAPVVFTTIALGILVWDHYDSLHPAAIILTFAALATVALRLAISFRLNRELLSSLQDDSTTDTLTGLGNRRKLFSDLDALFANGAPTGEDSHVFALFDLDGFKSYNDTFGHPAGDALLSRLGSRLLAALPRGATVYRLGGDEFCFLTSAGTHGGAALVSAGRAALSDSGNGFSIGASGGSAAIPEEAGSPSATLLLADQRMYAIKSTSPGHTAQQTRDLLRSMVREGEPTFGNHQDEVVELAGAIGRELEFDAEELDVLVRAAEFHDIGKIAIPQEILDKPGPLDPSEWELMRKHTLVGARLLSHSQAMLPIAELVRCSHERWDGDGYPNGLSGKAIPLGSRIILVADAFCAMTAGRPYQSPMTTDMALAELQSHAGTQFDPRIVEVVCRIVEDGPGIGQGHSAHVVEAAMHS
jgi:two-component system, cell cycle response regulator